MMEPTNFYYTENEYYINTPINYYSQSYYFFD